MSMEQLKADLKESLASVKTLDPATTTPADLVRFVKNTLWPTIEAIVEETDEMDASIGELSDMMDGVADVLNHETGTVFAGIIAGGLTLVGELDKLAIPPPLKLAIGEFRTLCKQGAEILDEIVLPESDDDDEDDDEDEDPGADNDNAEDDK